MYTKVILQLTVNTEINMFFENEKVPLETFVGSANSVIISNRKVVLLRNRLRGVKRLLSRPKRRRNRSRQKITTKTSSLA